MARGVVGVEGHRYTSLCVRLQLCTRDDFTRGSRHWSDSVGFRLSTGQVKRSAVAICSFPPSHC